MTKGSPTIEMDPIHLHEKRNCSGGKAEGTLTVHFYWAENFFEEKYYSSDTLEYLTTEIRQR